MRLALVITLLAPLIVAGPANAQTPAEPTAADNKLTTAEEHHNKGVEFFTAGDYAAALTEFRAAYELSQRVDILYNMAVASDKLGQLNESLGYLQSFLKAQPGNREALALQETISRKLAPQSARQPVAQMSKKPPVGASVLLGIGASLLIADVGTAAAATSLSKMVETQILSLQAYTDAQAQGQRLNQASIALLSLGLAFGVAGATWHLVAYGKQQRTP